MTAQPYDSLSEHARLKAERKLLGKKVFITRGYYKGHWGFIASAEDSFSFIVRGGTLSGLEPLVTRDEFRMVRDTDFTTQQSKSQQ